MLHYLKSKDGDMKLDVDMYCSFEGKEEERKCNGDCGSCCYGKAETSISTMAELLNRADCNYRR